MDNFEIVLPTSQDVAFDVLDPTLYDYNFQSFSIVALQEAAVLTVTNKIREMLINKSSFLELAAKSLGKKETEYVAEFTKEAKEKIASGEWVLGVKKSSGKNYGSLRDVVTGQTTTVVDLVEKGKDTLGHLPQLAAMQQQLNEVSKNIEELTYSIKRVEKGQYNDRYAGFYSARQQLIEGLVCDSEALKRELLSSALRSSTDTISKLILAVNMDSAEFISSKTSLKRTRELEGILQESISYLNACFQLNLVIYTVLEEPNAIKAVLKNYQSFVAQILLKETDVNRRSVAWLMDNNQKGNAGRFVELSNNVMESIQVLIETPEIKELELLSDG